MTATTTEELLDELQGRMEPRLLRVAQATARRAAALASPLLRPASVGSFDSTLGIADVYIDTEGAGSAPAITTPAQVITAYPLREGDRVMVLFMPPHGVFVVGHVNGFPIQSGFDDAGFIDTLQIAPAWDTIKSVQVGDGPLGRAYRLVATTTATLYSFTAGKFSAEVLLECSRDGGITWEGNVSSMTAPASDSFASCTVIGSIAGSSNEFRPRFRIRAHRLAAPAGAFDLRQFNTSWTVTPQEAG